MKIKSYNWNHKRYKVHSENTNRLEANSASGEGQDLTIGIRCTIQNITPNKVRDFTFHLSRQEAQDLINDLQYWLNEK
jgi:hypothetical protein